MFSKQQQKIKRMTAFIAILSKYGFKDVLSRMNFKPPQTSPESAQKTTQISVYARIRMVLEELGPTFVKLGQALSNREDILPKEFIKELQHLQDNVELADLAIHTLLADNFGVEYNDFFQDIETKALASASIAQVYRATLKNGEKVVLKVKRPHIEQVIQSDLLIMKDLALFLTTYFEFADHLSLLQAVQIFEKSLLKELSFVHERENIERFASYFKENKDIYVPKVYPYLSNNQILCMEFIEGAKITQTDFHAQHKLDPNALAEKGLQLYLSQILEFGFFHADPHAGNIMVLADGRIVFIDLGAMGIIYQSDQELLEDIIISIITKNITKLIIILKKMAIKLEIKDEKKLHQDLSEILKLVDTSNLENLDIFLLLNKFKDILFENKIIMPDYFTLLVRGLMLIESVGRTLNPSMNVIKSVKPYVAKILKKRLTPQYLWDKSLSKLGDLSQDIQNIPYQLKNVLQQLNDGKLTFKGEIKEMETTNLVLKNGFKDVVIALILGANMIATVLIKAFDKDGFWLVVLGFIFSIMLLTILFFRLAKK